MLGFRQISRKRNVSPSKQGTHQVARAAMVNGLPTLPELQSIDVDTAFVAPFSMPQELLSFVATDEDIATIFKNGVKERTNFCNTKLTDGEQEGLRKLQVEARLQNHAFLPSVASAAMRYVTRAQGDPEKAIKEMLATQAWRQSYFKNGPLTVAAVADDFKHGIVYWTGRDKGLRPALVVRPGRTPASWYKSNAIEKLLRLLVFSLEYMLRYLIFPGKVEVCTVIVDLIGCTCAQLPLSSIREICTLLGVHFIFRVHRMYVCHAPAAIQGMIGWALRLLTEKQRQKLLIVQNVQDLRQDFAVHQLEKQHGGSRPPSTSFFPFSLQAGPFNAGYCMGANTKAISNIHRAFTMAGIQGRAWNPALSREQNVKMEYTEFAKELFRQCDAPLPKNNAEHEDSNYDAKMVSTCDEVIPFGATPVTPCLEHVAIETSWLDVRKDDMLDTNAMTIRSSQSNDASAAVLKSAIAVNRRETDKPMDFQIDFEQVRPAKGLFSCMVCREP